MRAHHTSESDKVKEGTLSRRSAVLALVTAVLAVACGGTGHAASSTAANQPQPLRAAEPQDGKTVTLRPGQRLVVVLHSTYWQFAAGSHPKVLRRLAKPVVRPRRSGCVTGGGCGTVTATFVAVRPGSSVVAASRTSCGEAMGCSADAARYALHVRVR